MFQTQQNGHGFSVKAWKGDAKTLLAFNFTNTSDAANLAGFSILVTPQGVQPYYLLNLLKLSGAGHAVVAGEPANSTANAPIQKFRWLHVPGSFHQGKNPFYGNYTYTITPRYFVNGLLAAIDNSLTVQVTIDVSPYSNKGDIVELGFTRGFTQSQAFVHHFGKQAIFSPKNKELLFDTSAQAGANDAGETYTFAEEFEWSGFTARQRVFEILNEVAADKTLSIDVFAYDLNEPDVLKIFLQLAGEGRMRIILDNATLHHDKNGSKPEDQFEQMFIKAQKGNAAIKRGKFGRFSHDKIFIVKSNGKAVKVLTGSTNFSVTGMYVNSNHVLIFNDATTANLYSLVFDAAWQGNISESFNSNALAMQPFYATGAGMPALDISFSPHNATVATSVLNRVADSVTNAKQNVFFAVMDLSSGSGPVFPAVTALHAKQQIFSYGISDAPGQVSLYRPGTKDGVLVGGKPGQTLLPPPFDIERSISLGHQVHHKFIVIDFNTPDATLFCGSSNLALGGEESNGDNLIMIKDMDIAAVFAIEAIGLVDHFDFRDAHMSGKKPPATAPTAIKGQGKKAVTTAAKVTPSATLSLYDNDSWAQRYFNPDDLHCSDRKLFG